MLGMVSYACHPSTLEVETGGPLGLTAQPSLLGEFPVKVRYSFSKPKVDSD